MPDKGRCSACEMEFDLKNGKIPSHKVDVIKANRVVKVNCTGSGKPPRTFN